MSHSITKSLLLGLGSFFGMTAVMLGAFGAHGLEKILEPALLQRFQTGVQYQFYHTFALLVVGLWWTITPSRALYYAGIALTIGIILFSGSLYLYAMTSIKSFGMITPLGGLAFIAAWILMMYNAWKAR